MAIRLRLRVRSRIDSEVEMKALVNSGYEAYRPELLIPIRYAYELKLYPVLPTGSEVVEYVLADGSRTRLIRIPNAVEVSVVADDRVVGPVTCDVVVAEKADEALISDKLADVLQIVALAMGEGLWCFRDEIGLKIRRSV